MICGYGSQRLVAIMSAATKGRDDIRDADRIDHLSYQDDEVTDHALVGISPTYWSHVPLHIQQIHHLKLVNGIQCLTVETSAEQDSQDVGDTTTRPPASSSKIVPISKCQLVGIVVCVERKPNGSVIYVIDDGTGLIDCLHYPCILSDDPWDSLLPPLVQSSDQDDIFPVGECVKVMGRIQCISIQQASPVDTTDSSPKLTCIREIHATLVESVKTCYSSSLSLLDAERRHWDRCIRLYRATLIPTALAATEPPPILCNAKDVLVRLGPEIGRQVADRNNLPSADDKIGAWKLFGAKCKCQSSYKDALLCKYIIPQLISVFIHTFHGRMTYMKNLLLVPLSRSQIVIVMQHPRLRIRIFGIVTPFWNDF